jgi:hypothetical protein
MRISPAEQKAIKDVVCLGEQYGYGNLICHLKSAWSKKLNEEYGINQPMDGAYPIKMHIDLMEHGEWDETGERYK